MIAMEGRAFGRLTVIRRVSDTDSAKAKWECVCTCGTKTVVRGDHLRGGLTRSCGCLSADTRRQQPRPELPNRECGACGEPSKHLRLGWCSRCYQRWVKAGRPDSGPPPLQNMLLEDWRGIEVPAIDRTVTDLAAGTAGEHIVCADLLLAGFTAFRTDQMCAYDVAVDLGGRLIRLQVKSTRTAKPIPQRLAAVPTYRWHVKRAGKGGRRKYEDDAFDLYVLVALDIRQVAYVPPSHAQTIIDIRPPGATTGKQFEDYPFTRALAGIGMLP